MKNLVQDFIDEVSKKVSVSEFIINGNDNVYVEKEGELIRMDIKFSDSDIENFCQDIASYNKKPFGSETPTLDGNLPDGSRVNFIHKDYTKTSHAITIRRYLKNISHFDANAGIFGLNERWITFLKYLVKARVNLIVSGGTGVGKTTLLNLLLQEIGPKERIITIEDTRELQFNHTDIVRLEARNNISEKGLSIRDLVKNSLRMRPDRIILGEVRGGEVFDLLQAMNTGHQGSMTSIHSNSPSECLSRLENLFLLSGYDLPLKALRYQVCSAIDFIIQVKRDRQGKRVISQIIEVGNMDGDRILIQDVGLFKNDKLEFSGLVPSCMDRLHQAGLPRDFFIK
ncbi:MAG: CpaF family protein [Bacteriovoracaceae bacterium]